MSNHGSISFTVLQFELPVEVVFGFFYGEYAGYDKPQMNVALKEIAEVTAPVNISGVTTCEQEKVNTIPPFLIFLNAA